MKVVGKRHLPANYDDDLADMEVPLSVLEAEERRTLIEGIKQDKIEEERERQEMLKDAARKKNGGKRNLERDETIGDKRHKGVGPQQQAAPKPKAALEKLISKRK